MTVEERKWNTVDGIIVLEINRSMALNLKDSWNYFSLKINISNTGGGELNYRIRLETYLK